MRLRSQCYHLRLQKPDLDMEALEARSCLPPELLAGKRGGWNHDSVYPSFASPPCPTGVELRLESLANKLLPRCLAVTSQCVAPPRRRHRRSTRRVRWASCSLKTARSCSTAAT